MNRVLVPRWCATIRDPTLAFHSLRTLSAHATKRHDGAGKAV
jgi:hypothetical protein